MVSNEGKEGIYPVVSGILRNLTSRTPFLQLALRESGIHRGNLGPAHETPGPVRGGYPEGPFLEIEPDLVLGNPGQLGEDEDLVPVPLVYLDEGFEGTPVLRRRAELPCRERPAPRMTMVNPMGCAMKFPCSMLSRIICSRNSWSFLYASLGVSSIYPYLALRGTLSGSF